MLNIEQTVFVLIDVQGRLAQAMYERALLIGSLRRALQGLRALGVPVLWTEQNPARMGGTIPELAQLLPGEQPLPKMAFSCAGEPEVLRRLEALGRRQALLGGIEAHVCVFQTAADLLARGYETHILADGVSSRTARNRQIGLQRAAAEGARISSVEMALFELLRSASHPAFREILRLVR